MAAFRKAHEDLFEVFCFELVRSQVFVHQSVFYFVLSLLFPKHGMLVDLLKVSKLMIGVIIMNETGQNHVTRGTNDRAIQSRVDINVYAFLATGADRVDDGIWTQLI